MLDSLYTGVKGLQHHCWAQQQVMLLEEGVGALQHALMSRHSPVNL